VRKRFGARELAAATLIVGVAVVYWSARSAPPVTRATDDGSVLEERP
jgi:hypothetical protein